MSDLRLGEKLVLLACIHAVEDNNGEFCDVKDIKTDGFTKNQFKGYLGQLVLKGKIEIYDMGDYQQLTIR